MTRAERFKTYRKRLGLTQPQTALVLGYGLAEKDRATFISGKENGRHEITNRDLLALTGMIAVGLRKRK